MTIPTILAGLLLSGTAHAGAVGYHFGVGHSRIDGEALETARGAEAVYTYDPDRAAVATRGSGTLHSLTWYPDGAYDLAGLDSYLRLGLTQGTNPDGEAYSLGDLDFMFNVATNTDGLNLALNLYWPTVSLEPEGLSQLRWSGAAVFVGPQLYTETSNGALYIAPLVDFLWPLSRTLITGAPFRLHLRLTGGAVWAPLDWFFLSAEANVARVSDFDFAVPTLEVSSRAGLGIRF